MDTGQLFHNNLASEIEGAVTFYSNAGFQSSPDAVPVNLNPTEQGQLANFLRVLNAAENIRQVRKRVQFIRDHRTAGNTQLIVVSLTDVQDALNDLHVVTFNKDLNPTAQSHLAAAQSVLTAAQTTNDNQRPALMDQVLSRLTSAENDLFTSNPDHLF